MKVKDILETVESKENPKDDANSPSFLSILQRSYIAIQPILQEMHKRLVPEEGGPSELISKAEKYVTSDEIKFDK